MQKEMTEVKSDIKERKSRLTRDVREFEKSLSKQEASRLKNSRGKILIYFYLPQNVSYIIKISCLEQLQKQVETSHSYLSNEAEGIRKRLASTKHMVGRDIESNIE